MKKGYQLLEVRALDNFAKWPHQHILLVPILFWLVDEINLELKTELKNVQLEVIKAQYLGPAYPALGIHYFNRKNPDDVGPIVETAIERLLNKKSVFDFVKFAEKGNINWNEVLTKLMTDSTEN
jgi:hypothetical protein